MRELKKRLLVSLAVLAAIFTVGVAGYTLIEGWKLIDALYMTVITLSTVGYREAYPLSQAGKLFTISIIIFGVGAFVYFASSVTASLLEGDLTGYLKGKIMKSRIDALENHYIVCGADEVGLHIIGELEKTRHSFVVIDSNPENIEKLRDRKDVLWLQDNPSEDETLVAAGIGKARGLFSALPDDKENLFVIITARNLNLGLKIVARTIDESSVPKLTRAGANAVVAVNVIGGLRMASEMIRPSVVNYMDAMMRRRDPVLRVEEMGVPPGSTIIGKTLKEAQLRDLTGVVVLAVRAGGGEERGECGECGPLECNPRSSCRINEGDTLIVVGQAEQVEKARKLYGLVEQLVT